MNEQVAFVIYGLRLDSPETVQRLIDASMPEDANIERPNWTEEFRKDVRSYHEGTLRFYKPGTEGPCWLEYGPMDVEPRYVQVYYLYPNRLSFERAWQMARRIALEFDCYCFGGHRDNLESAEYNEDQTIRIEHIMMLPERIRLKIPADLLTHSSVDGTTELGNGMLEVHVGFPEDEFERDPEYLLNYDGAEAYDRLMAFRRELESRELLKDIFSTEEGA